MTTTQDSKPTAFDREKRVLGPWPTDYIVESLLHSEEFAKTLREELFHRFREEDTTKLQAINGNSIYEAELMNPRDRLREIVEYLADSPQQSQGLRADLRDALAVHQQRQPYIKTRRVE